MLFEKKSSYDYILLYDNPIVRSNYRLIYAFMVIMSKSGIKTKYYSDK